MSDDGSEAPAPYEIQYEDAGEDEEEETHSWLVRDGVATATFPDGATYHGPYAGGKRHGKGTYTWANGAVYTGDYAEGERTGRGEMKYPDGSRYVGEWKGGLKEGRGAYFYANGDRFAGQWKDDEKTGEGTYIDGASHSMLVGVWERGTLVSGHLQAHDGTQWRGSFVGNRPAGAGRFEFASGVRVEGSFTAAGKFRPAAVAAAQ